MPAQAVLLQTDDRRRRLCRVRFASVTCATVSLMMMTAEWTKQWSTAQPKWTLCTGGQHFTAVIILSDDQLVNACKQVGKTQWVFA